MTNLETLSWPLSRLGEALEALARNGGRSPRPAKVPPPPANITGDGNNALGEWIESAAGWLGLEAEPAEIPYGDVEELLEAGDVTLLRLPGVGEARFLALLGKRGRMLSVLGPDLVQHRIRPEVVRWELCREMESPLEAEVERLLQDAGVPKRCQKSVRAGILRERLSMARITGCWVLRLPPGASFWVQARNFGLRRRLLVLVGVHIFQYTLWLVSWWVIGRGALDGRLDKGWLLGWALLLLTLVPLRLVETWYAGVLAIGAGGLLKKRLLYGALRLEPEEIRHQGAGQLLGCVLEVEAVESLALSGGFLGLVAGIEIAMAATLLGTGAGGLLLALLLLGWVAVSLIIGRIYFRQRRRWTDGRLKMTDGLVERMVGHRTRLAQESRDRWHDGEDQALERYLEASASMDRVAALLMAFVPRGWTIVGLLGIAPAFVSGTASPPALIVSLGGIVLAHRALEKLTAGLWHLAGARIAWTQVAPLFFAARRASTAGSPAFAVAQRARSRSSGDRDTVIDARELVFRYPNRAEPILQGCSLEVRAGDRVLLEGPSGGGKSTLASLLVGLRLPESGLLLLRGLDYQTLGLEGWRRRVVAAPQFHENHVLTGTFAFNLLMGRRWPADPKDFQEAETLCRELGLGDLLNRMPAGLLQMVGETGWQLSHGERSRLYIARALLQGAELIVLDESFAALDPETLRLALRCVLDRASTLLVIAHP